MVRNAAMQDSQNGVQCVHCCGSLPGIGDLGARPLACYNDKIAVCINNKHLHDMVATLGPITACRSTATHSTGKRRSVAACAPLLPARPLVDAPLLPSLVLGGALSPPVPPLDAAPLLPAPPLADPLLLPVPYLVDAQPLPSLVLDDTLLPPMPQLVVTPLLRSPLLPTPLLDDAPPLPHAIASGPHPTQMCWIMLY